MKALLICPGERPSVPLFSELAPLSNLCLLGQSLLEYWLSSLATGGVKEITILSHDRSEYVRALVGDGARWGLKVEVIEESRELTPAQALLKYPESISPSPLTNGVAVLDHFPGSPEQPIFASYASCFAALHAWLPHATTPDRVGIRQIRENVWVGLRSRIAPTAQLHAPCWIGKNVFIGERAIVGPNAIIEDNSFIESDVQVLTGHIGSDTFVGQFAELRESFAWGNTLVNWKLGSAAKVPDSFLLCALRQPKQPMTGGWMSRMARLCARNKEDVQLIWKHLLMNKEADIEITKSVERSSQ